MIALILLMLAMGVYGIFGGHVGGGIIALIGALILIQADRRMSVPTGEQHGDTPESKTQNQNPDLEK